jgi:S-DNA-T family DNA segregation ATPase FtsK/SpoIIIE
MNITPQPSSDEKLRYSLDLQAHQIDAVLERHQVEGKVTSGSIQQRLVEFDVQAPLSAGLERMRGLKDSVIAALGVRDVAVTKQDGRWRLQIERAYEPPVALTALLADLPDLPAGTAVVGLADSGRPVLLSFGDKAVKHVLVAGAAGAGKTTLLRTMAISLALTNRQSDVQLLLIDGSDGDMVPRSWQPLTYLPHLMTDPVSGPELSAEVLHFLVGEMAYRRKQRVRLPRIVVLIDHAVSLLESGGRPVTDDLLSLLQHGANAGIHVVLATERPESPLLDVLFMSNLLVRVMGRLDDPAQEQKMAGATETQASYLGGGGEFIALANGEQTYFQAADIDDYELHWELNRVYSNQRPRLLARPYSTRPVKRPADPVPPAGTRAFTREPAVQWADSPAASATGRRPAPLPHVVVDSVSESAGDES